MRGGETGTCRRSAICCNHAQYGLSVRTVGPVHHGAGSNLVHVRYWRKADIGARLTASKPGGQDLFGWALKPIRRRPR